MALAWVIARPGVTAPIASATTLPQVDSLIRAASLKLSAADIAELDAASAPVGVRPAASTPSSLSRLTAVGGIGGGFGERDASMSSSSQAASVSPISRSMNSSLLEAGGIGGRKRALIVPG